MIVGEGGFQFAAFIVVFYLFLLIYFMCVVTLEMLGKKEKRKPHSLLTNITQIPAKRARVEPKKEPISKKKPKLEAGITVTDMMQHYNLTELQVSLSFPFSFLPSSSPFKSPPPRFFFRLSLEFLYFVFLFFIFEFLFRICV
jgi:hypothetical protein